MKSTPLLSSSISLLRQKKRRLIELLNQDEFRKWSTWGLLVCVLSLQLYLIDFNGHNPNEDFHLQSFQSKWICQWSRTDHDECNNLLAERLPPQIVPLNGLKRKGDHPGPRKQRWLFFGDSTMRRQFTSSNLDRHLVGEPIHFIKKGRNGVVDPCWTSLDCEERTADRCEMAEVYGFEPLKEWKPPSFFPNFEGPVNYGLEHPFCSDCGGCNTQFLHCNINKAANRNDIKKCGQKKLTYGGYMKVEFARDVELQTEFYQTTQENTALYLKEHFNKPELVKEWGKPICVILTGFHDMILLIKTEHFELSRYVENVEWYLKVMKPECSHIIWLSNTAPSFENEKKWPQTVSLTRDWNDGVKKMIERNHELQSMTTIVDLFAASLEIPRNDHIHLIDEWYNDVGHFFSALVTERPISEI